MIERCRLGTPSYTIAFLVAVLLIATGFTLLHWHKDFADQGCQLCHIRHLPSLHSAFAPVYGISAASQQDWVCEYSAKELETCVRNTSSRSPPRSTSFAA